VKPLGEIHRTPLVFCPACQAPISASTGPLDDGPDRGPQPGDVAVCLNCSTILLYGPGMALVKADANTLNQLLDEAPELADMVIQATAARRDRPR
jgi:hypothetical protein